MLRLSKADFEDPHELAKYAATCGISLEEFRKQFYYLIENDLLYKYIKEGKINLAAVESNKAYEYKPELVKKENGDSDHLI